MSGQITNGQVVYPENETPPHTHVFEWDDDSDMYESNIVGIICTFTWLIPPGPRGKKTRTRMCRERIDMDRVLEIVNSRPQGGASVVGGYRYSP